jgi:benzoyl-CoA reductase/2-hydroxyglutaryl-CoA dehydratase subunit BcrC/BadD/HgdB
MDNSQRVGITATLPVEVIFAAGMTPVDLNNAFITGPDPAGMIDRAERAGLPQSTCAWIKGIYITARDMNITSIVGVTGGDCTNTRALLEILESEGIETLDFSYPYPADRTAMQREIECFCSVLGTDVGTAEEVRLKLQPVRHLATEIDRLTWDGSRVTGAENHRLQVSMSDFEGDYVAYEEKLRTFIASVESRPVREGTRIGLLGVPPILTDLHDYIESLGAVVVFNEFQRQFAMPCPAASLAQQYTAYTYPYTTNQRMEDVDKEISRRSIDGIIHYVQNFCWRQLADGLVRDALNVPVLTLQADKPGIVSGPVATRIEAFVEILQE